MVKYRRSQGRKIDCHTNNGYFASFSYDFVRDVRTCSCMLWMFHCNYMTLNATAVLLTNALHEVLKLDQC